MNRSIPRKTAASLLAFTLCSPAILLGAATSASHYDLRVVRIENPPGSVLYRLDSTSGEICAFSSTQNESGVLRGCFGSEERPVAGRFTLEALSGVRGTGHSSAYRLDRISGEICRFQLRQHISGSLEKVGCIRQADPSAP